MRSIGRLVIFLTLAFFAIAIPQDKREANGP